MVKKTLKIIKGQCANGKFWHAIDENNHYGIVDGQLAYKSYPMLDITKPMGDMAISLPDELEGTMQEVLIMDGYAIMPTLN